MKTTMMLEVTTCLECFEKASNVIDDEHTMVITINISIYYEAWREIAISPNTCT